MSDILYSDLKAAWHIDRIQQLREGKQIAPVELQFILSDLCNQDCYFCAYRAEQGLSSEGFVEWKDGKRVHNPNRRMPTQKAMEILRDARELGAKSVIFTGGGEPTAHPHHLQVFQHALDLGYECSLNTNGLVLRKGWEGLYPRFVYIRISVDAGNAEEYARIRRVPASQYETVLGHIRQMTEAAQGKECVVGVGYVVTPDNYEHVFEGVERLRETGVAYVRLASMQSQEQQVAYGDHYEDAKHVCENAQYLSTETFKVVNLFDLTQGVQAADRFCGMQQFVCYIGGNLKIYRCCYTAYTALGEIGDLHHQSFREWFESGAKRMLIEHFDARACAVCPLEHKNQRMRYMIDPAPPHVNFV